MRKPRNWIPLIPVKCACLVHAGLQQRLGLERYLAEGFLGLDDFAAVMKALELELGIPAHGEVDLFTARVI